MSSSREVGETDIYEDLPNFQFDHAFKKLEEDKAYLQNKVEELGEKLEELQKENEKLSSKVKALGKNISCLYKTAQREIERKEKIIADLRKERDDLIFKRGLQDSKPNYTRRPSRKQLTPTKKVRNGGVRRIFDGKGKSEAVNCASITPSSEEYEQICSVSSVDAEKSKSQVNNKESLTPNIIDLTECDSGNECLVQVKPSVKVKKKEAQSVTSNKSSEIEPEKSVSSPPCDDRQTDKTKIKELQSADSCQTPEVSANEEEKISVPNNETVDEMPLKEPNTANSNQTPDVRLDEGKSTSPSSNSRNVETTTPTKDKISVHMSSEDCGFGRRRVRRVVKPSLSPATPVTTAQEERGVKRTLEETQETGSKTWKTPQLLAVEVKQADPRVQKRRCVDGVLQAENRHGELGKSDEDCGSSSKKGAAVSETGSSCSTNSGDLLVLNYGTNKDKEVDGVSSVLNTKASDMTRQEKRIPKSDKCDNSKEKGRNDQESKRVDSEVAKHYGSSFVSAFDGDTNNITHNVEFISSGELNDETAVSKQVLVAPRCSSSSEKEINDRINNRREENGYWGASPTHSGASDVRRSPRHSPCGSRTTDDEPSGRRSWDRERVSRPSGHRDERMKCSGEGASSAYRKSSPQRKRCELEGQGGRDHREPSDKGRESSRGCCGKEHPCSERNHGYSRGSGRSGNGDRERMGDCDGERSRDPDRSRIDDRERFGDYDGERSRGPDRSRDHDGSSRDRDRGRSSDHDRARSRDCDRRRSWDCDSEKSGDHDKVGERSGFRDRDRERSGVCIRDRERNMDHDRLKANERGRVHDRRREPNVNRSFNSGRDPNRGRDPERVQDLDRSWDSDRGREASRGSRDSDRSRDSGRSRDNRKFHGHRSRSKECSPGRSGGRELCQSKSIRRPGGREYDLREKLNESYSPSSPTKSSGKKWNVYKDWDKPSNEDNERNERWCTKTPNSHNRDGIKSPDNRRKIDTRECRPLSSPEWD